MIVMPAGLGIARPAASGGLPQPSWANVVSLLHFDGLNGGSATADAKSGRSWGAAAGVVLSTTASQFGGSSLYMPGSGNTLSHSDHADFEFGGDDFTIEGWIRPAALPGANQYPGVFSKQVSDSSQISFMCYLNQNNSGVVFQYSVDGTNRQFASNGAALTLGAFHHLAISRVGNALRVFVDGASGSPADMTGKTIFNSSAAVQFGRRGSGVIGNYFTGWIDEWRVCRQGLYSSNFTPPSAPFPNS